MTQSRLFEWKTLIDQAPSHDGQATLGHLDSSWIPWCSPSCFLPISSLVVSFSVSFLSCLKLFLVLSRPFFSSPCLLSLSDLTILVFQMFAADWWLPNCILSAKFFLLGSRFSICMLMQHSHLVTSGQLNLISEGQERRWWGDTPSPRSKKPQ